MELQNIDYEDIFDLLVKYGSTETLGTNDDKNKICKSIIDTMIKESYETYLELESTQEVYLFDEIIEEAVPETLETLNKTLGKKNNLNLLIFKEQIIF